jgi:sulfate adenylyltransferase subunit 2
MYRRSHLRTLEDEAVYILRELVAETERVCLLFSGGKDSIVLVHLAQKAFRPARFPFPLLHIDTGHNFPETIAFRDHYVAAVGEQLLVETVQASIDAGRVTDESGPRASRNRLQTTTLLDAIAKHRFQAAIGGARRDEERSRAKERIFSHRDEFGQWDPKNQRPEPWSQFNTRLKPGEHLRVFPLSNWTELDVWEYIRLETIPVPALYFAHEREVFERDGMLYAVSPFVQRLPGEHAQVRRVRFRTIGDMTCTGAIESLAPDVDSVIEEVALSRITERGATRADDRFTEAAMEDRKREGYF